MFENLKRKIDYALKGEGRQPPQDEKDPLRSTVDDNMLLLRQKFPESMDLNTREMAFGKTKIALLTCEGLVNAETLAISVIGPLSRLARQPGMCKEKLVDFIMHKSILSPEQKEFFDFDALFKALMSGFAVLLIDGESRGFAFGVQGYKYRSIDDATNETNELGPKEAFVEPIRVNLSMVRRRIKSPNLQFELMTLGAQSKTDVCLVYMNDRTSASLLREIRLKLQRVNLDIILDSSYLRPYLENHPFALFSSVGTTERPDIVCGKIAEGRVAVLVDGSPFALILPFLFSENFKSFDDYAHRPYFSTFVRLLKYFSFYLSFLLPGAYVAITTFHPELLPHELLFSIAASEEIIPFSLMVEALFIYLVFEIMREAGIRLPSAVGHTIGIVGALVIGDAAVNAGLIGAPMVMVVAITAICAFSVPQLYEPIMILRFAFIIIGGYAGLFGIALGAVTVSALICSMNSMHIPVTAPLSPLDQKWLGDSILFGGIRRLSGRRLKIQNINGSEIPDREGLKRND